MIVLRIGFERDFALHLSQEKTGSYKFVASSFETGNSFTFYRTPTEGYNKRACKFSYTLGTNRKAGLYLLEVFNGSTLLCTHLLYITDEPTGDSLGTNSITYYDA
jgi:hypothetical protein